MRFMKAVAVLGSLIAGAAGLAGAAAASPLISRAGPAAATPSLVERTQVYVDPWGRPVYRPVRPIVRPYPVYRRQVVQVYPAYRPRRVVQVYPAYRPRRVVQVYPAYRPRRVVHYRTAPYPRRVVRAYPAYRPVRVVRPAPRVVCTTRYRLVRTAYGDFVRRPVRRCIRRW